MAARTSDRPIARRPDRATPPGAPPGRRSPPRTKAKPSVCTIDLGGVGRVRFEGRAAVIVATASALVLIVTALAVLL